VKGATPGEYLERLQLQNQIFNARIRLRGVVDQGDGKISIVTDQPWVEGPDAPVSKIDWFIVYDLEFERLDAGLFYDAATGLLIADVFPKNAKLSNGLVHVFDPVVQRVAPSLRHSLGFNPTFSAARKDDFGVTKDLA